MFRALGVIEVRLSERDVYYAAPAVREWMGESREVGQNPMLLYRYARRAALNLAAV